CLARELVVALDLSPERVVHAPCERAVWIDRLRQEPVLVVLVLRQQRLGGAERAARARALQRAARRRGGDPIAVRVVGVVGDVAEGIRFAYQPAVPVVEVTGDVR